MNFIKNFFIVLFLSFLFISNSFGLTKSAEDEYFIDCMEGASEVDASNRKRIVYCKCVVNYIDERFNNESFEKFVNGPKSQTDKFLHTLAAYCNSKVTDV